jgi:nucleotide-binding universal stress UspA family protein
MADLSRRTDAECVISTEGGDVSGSIICGVDGSPESRLALRVAAQLSGQLGLRLVVAHVAPATLYAPSIGIRPLLTAPTAEELAASERLLEKISVDERLPDAESRVLYGVPADRLADLADEENAELIVVGSRGRGAFKAAVLGSVSNDLIGVAGCPVLVVPPRTAGAATGPDRP